MWPAADGDDASQKDFHSETVVGRNGETIGEICNKYFKTKEDVSTEDRQRVLRFLENMCLGAAAVGYRTESMHGAGSPQAQRIMIARQGNIQPRSSWPRTSQAFNKDDDRAAGGDPPQAVLPRYENLFRCSE